MEILLLDDMDAEETLQLQTLIHLRLENLSFLMEFLNVANQSGNSEEECLGPLDVLIPSLHKSSQIGRTFRYAFKIHNIFLEKWRTPECRPYSIRGRGFHQSHFYRFIS
ncbi:hypothetical protein HS088_TW06G00273 [Tripterygium wilfordii]|uniref:Uncharacterized protein n=1 Tax=Tripterygium wilfordii TaxID=458696 RepID=A0A7J7DII2_TRIWF|nr:hypothetical protein HS088_TW06G00273 [Tripterygium wilfordii]